MAKKAENTFDKVEGTIKKLEEVLSAYDKVVKDLPKKAVEVPERIKKGINAARNAMTELNLKHTTFNEENKKDYKKAEENLAKFLKEKADLEKQAPVDTKKLTEEQKENYEEALKNVKTVGKETVKERKEVAELLASATKKYKEDELVAGKKHTTNLEGIAEQQVEVEGEKVDTVLDLNQRFSDASGKIGKIMDKTWDEKYEKSKKVTEKIKGALTEANTAIGNMFGAITKNIDLDISKKKEELTELTKSLTQAQKDLTLMQKQSAEELSKAKSEYLDDKEAGGENRKDVETELAELETLHNLKNELDAENKKHAEEADYQDKELTEGQLKRYNDLMQTHSAYGNSLQEKTDKDKEANDKVATLEAEKIKKEDEIRKKEKEKKKVEVAQQYTQGAINIALGITKAWALGPIVGPIMAAVVGAAGAVQLAYMSKQIDKLEDGGLLHGKRHSQGGMPILGSNIEVEGGEYVVNRQSTGKNLGLLHYINSERRELSPADMDSFFASAGRRVQPSFAAMLEEGGQLPAMLNTAQPDSYMLMDAIQSIKFEPKVSVTDINSVQADVVKVDSWVGM